ncbi:uncharacterized protein G2W53_043466 [Senna tora]|uniref:Uncharacterized protein n=1 Tax=Senna tora TaxID=362788 RepID=A0A834SH33_9FABA|nr:uncharacterized protein G2W53_043466 [Senna tora]
MGGIILLVIEQARQGKAALIMGPNVERDG